MSDKRPITPVDAVDAVTPRTAIWRQMQVAIAAREAQSTADNAPAVTLGEEHFHAVAAQLREQPLFGHDFEHTNSFFHRFMRAAADGPSSSDLHHMLIRDTSVRPHQTVLSPNLKAQLSPFPPAKMPYAPLADRRQRIVEQPQASTKRSAAQTAVSPTSAALPNKTGKARGSLLSQANFTGKLSPNQGETRSKLGTHEKMLRDGDLWDQEPRYKLSRVRRRQRLWGDKFTLTRPYGREPFYFDHSTTFYPLELKPPPDVDFIPFELYAALGVMVGWQWMVDEFVRQDFVSDRTHASALEVFLTNYRLIGITPAAALQGAVAHYPSEEHMMRILQYLALRARAKARMRIELLDRSGKTVAEVWADYGILRRTAQSADPVVPGQTEG